MLTAVSSKKSQPGAGRFAIVASQYNPEFVDAMVREAQAELQAAGVLHHQLVRVPGAFEIPIVAARLAHKRGSVPDAIICLGVILRGQTSHADHIGREVTRALMDIQLAHGVTVIHEVLLLENEEQARARCLPGKFSRGREAAQTALAMAAVMRDLGHSRAT